MGVLGIIAGRGALPAAIAEDAAGRGERVYVLRLAGFEEPALAGFPGDVVGLGETGRQVRLLKEAGVTDLVFAGEVKRPDFSRMKLDMKGARLLPRVISAARKGDDALLRTLLQAFASEGFNIIGAHEANRSLLAPDGPIGRHRPDEAALADLDRAMVVAAEIGRLDIGQGCVVCRGLVLAVEAQEGTDRMLERAAALEPELRGDAAARAGVLAKRPKPIQERRIDLPTIGVSTVEKAAAAGLAGIGVEAGGALLIDRAGIAARADALGLFVVGLAAGEAGG